MSNTEQDWTSRKPIKSRKSERSPDPTPMDIARRCALIRATWDDETRVKRAGMMPEDFQVYPMQVAAPAR